MELDYQTALLLQYQLERAHKRKEDTTSDHQLALQLQDQFNTEELVERPVNNLVYKAPTNANPAKCLVDPSWEVIDPTPDIHVLFTAFDQKFFWSSLGSVTVSWSKRMTSCAGICAYQGRGGMCSITLSEPLLKLRPRKDLVETLLHEMIHAYLFVTENNRDRDGHGPEFHRHMYRINAEAGTNITVYHDFHDEVKLYQQHWWRCNGPCQQWHPYFGMVRRATNRPPGPNDRWWNDHASRCGGSFIKVKSPEGAGKPSKASKEKLQKTQSSTDIRKYITTSTTNGPLKASTSSTTKNPSNENNTAPLNRQNSLPAKVHTVGNPSVSNPQVSNVIPSQTSNIFGFTNLSKSSSKKPRGNTAIKNAGSSTFVVSNKKSNSSFTKENEYQGVAASGVEPFAGPGRSLGAPSSTKLSDYSAVREHWLKKFENSVKRPPTGLSSPALAVAANKRTKIADDRVECPVCAKRFKPEDLNAHLDQCLQETHTNKECIVCSYSISAPEYEAHVARCSSKHFKDAEKEDCTKKCPACDVCVPKHRYNTHLQNCLLGLCEDFEEKYSDTTTTSCLACGKEIVKSDLDAHLENCMSMSNVFDTTHVPIEEKEDDGKKESSFNCPFCMELIEEGEMKAHIDGCLRQANEEKNALVISICDSDSD